MTVLCTQVNVSFTRNSLKREALVIYSHNLQFTVARVTRFYALCLRVARSFLFGA